MSISKIDIVIILIYMVGIVLLGVLSTRKQKLTSENYFLAGRGLSWPLMDGHPIRLAVPVWMPSYPRKQLELWPPGPGVGIRPTRPVT